MVEGNTPPIHPPVSPDWNPKTDTSSERISPYPHPVLAIAGDVLALLYRLELQKEEQWVSR